MGYSFDFDLINHILRVRFTGNIDDDEMRRYDDSLRRLLVKIHPRVAVVDFSEITKFDVSSFQIRILAHAEPEIKDPSVPIFIIAPPTHIYGAARMYQILSDDRRPTLQVVRSADEAFSQLGSIKPQFEPLPSE